MLMEPVRDAQKALEHAMALTGKACPKVLFYPRPQTGLSLYKIKTDGSAVCFLLLVFSISPRRSARIFGS